MEQNKIFVQDIVDRMKTVLRVSKDKEIAEYFGSSRSAPGVWKNRGRIPIAECITLAQREGISLDWLILGRDVPAIGDVQKKNELLADLQVFDSAHFFEPAVSAAYWSVPRRWLEQEGLDALETILVRASDDSMRGTIEAGQLVLVDTRNHESDGVYLLRFGDILRFKRVQHMADGTIRLSCDSMMYQPEIIAPDQKERLLIIGRCHLAFSPVR